MLAKLATSSIRVKTRLTIRCEGPPDPDIGHVGEHADELEGGEPRAPLVLRTLVETELVLLVQGSGDGVALGEDGRRDLAPVALDDEVVGRSSGTVLSDSEGEGQHLIVRETLVTE